MDRQHFKNHFTTEDRATAEENAIAEIKAAGLHPFVTDVPATENKFHYHNFDAMTFVINGELEVTLRDTGEVYTVCAGDMTMAPAGIVHKEKHNGFRAVFGFSIPPEKLSQPIDILVD